MSELLSEKKIKQRQQRRALRPYKKVAVKLGRVGMRAGRGIVRGTQKLGKEGQKPRKPYKEPPIDLGFGAQPRKKSRPSSYESQVRSMLSKAQKIKVAREKRRVKRERALRNRLS